MKISIAMATYNGEAYVLEQLESFVAQTRQPDELIITDDCSSDRTIKILEEFKNKVSFTVKIYNNKTNLGYIQNFNKALELCTGDLIFLSDQDDVWFPTKIDYMIDLTVAHPDKALFMIDTRLTDGELKESKFTKQGQIKDLGLTESSFVMGCCIAIKRNLLQPILPIPKTFKLGHDDWLVNISDILNLRYVSDSVQQYYRIHGDNTSTSIANNLFKMEKINTPKISLSDQVINWIHFSKIIVFQRYIDENLNIIRKLEKLLNVEEYTPAVSNKLNSLNSQNECYKQRLNVLKSKNRLNRMVKAFELYKNGVYNSFNGLKTCFSDIVRS